MERRRHTGIAGKSPEEKHHSHDSLFAYSNDADGVVESFAMVSESCCGQVINDRVGVLAQRI